MGSYGIPNMTTVEIFATGGLGRDTDKWTHGYQEFTIYGEIIRTMKHNVHFGLTDDLENDKNC